MKGKDEAGVSIGNKKIYRNRISRHMEVRDDGPRHARISKLLNPFFMDFFSNSAVELGLLPTDNGHAVIENAEEEVK